MKQLRYLCTFFCLAFIGGILHKLQTIVLLQPNDKKVKLQAGLPEGIDRAIRRFQRGEKSHLHFRGSRYTYGKDAPLEYNLPDNAELDFSVFLRSFEKVFFDLGIVADIFVKTY